MDRKNTEIVAVFRINSMMTQDGQNGDPSVSAGAAELLIRQEYKDEIKELLKLDSDKSMQAVVPALILASKFMVDPRHNVGNEIEIPLSFFEGAGAMYAMMGNI